MQGPSELGNEQRDTKLAKWDIKTGFMKLPPTLMIGCKEYDTMDPKAMEEAKQAGAERKILILLNGSHLCDGDDQKVFMNNCYQVY